MRALLVAAALATLHARSAHAEDPEARRLLDEGTRLFTEDANYPAARATFQRSYAAEPSWRALNGVALTYQEQERHLDAIVTYEALLREFDATLTDDQRATVKRRLSALEAKVGVLEVRADQTAAAIALDGVPLGVAPLRESVRVMPGKHVVVATLAGYETLTRTLDVSAGSRTPVALVLAPVKTIVKVAPVRYERRFPRWAPYAAFGGAGALVAGGIVLQLVARSNFDEFDRRVAAVGSPTSVPGDTALRDRAILQDRLSIGAFAVGGLGVVAGGLLMALNQPRAVEVVPARDSVAVRVRF